MNIAYYFLSILDSPDVSTRNTIGGPIEKTINNLDLTKHHLKTVERTWLTVIRCKYIEV